MTISLKDFIHRVKVIKLFRDLLRKSSKISNKLVRENIKNEIRTNFRINSKVKDPMALKLLLVECNRSSEQLDSLLMKESQMNSDPNTDDTEGRIGEGWPW